MNTTNNNGLAVAAALVAGVTLSLTCLFAFCYAVGMSTGGHDGGGQAFITVFFFVGSAASVALGLASSRGRAS